MPYRKVVCAFNSIASVRTECVIVISNNIVASTKAKDSIRSAFRVGTRAISDGDVVVPHDSIACFRTNGIVMVADDVVRSAMTEGTVGSALRIASGVITNECVKISVNARSGI